MARRLRPVELGFLLSAPQRMVFTAGMSAAPKTVYRALAEDVSDWPRWFSAISAATPTRGGAGRDIQLRVGIRFEETILAADPDERYAYRVDTVNAPGLRALAEEWWIAPAPGGSRVRWTFAADCATSLRMTLPLIRPGLTVSFRGAVRTLDRRLARAR
ncbi:SRPBCC family protein [Streptomyces jumonjinensis]|uniref:SRPBCC family protein n=1 Tax=Streptomyces jumonjinensis TaxID=1945 RepID=A0A646KCV5_STRJU|nr:SRPBCC family protein [Streptomyces jumonjinensis]MQT00065.1 SRPBCC family protein [Streptomyces jumonjinensis]